MKAGKEFEYFSVQDLIEMEKDNLHAKILSKLDDIFASTLQKYFEVNCFQCETLNQVAIGNLFAFNAKH